VQYVRPHNRRLACCILLAWLPLLLVGLLLLCGWCSQPCFCCCFCRLSLCVARGRQLVLYITLNSLLGIFLLT